MTRHTLARGWIVAAACLGATALGLAVGPVGDALAEQVRSRLWTDASSRQPSIVVDMPTLSALAEQLSPSVVSITVVQSGPSRDDPSKASCSKSLEFWLHSGAALVRNLLW